jgi:hypothetical protein
MRGIRVIMDTAFCVRICVRGLSILRISAELRDQRKNRESDYGVPVFFWIGTTNHSAVICHAIMILINVYIPMGDYQQLLNALIHLSQVGYSDSLPMLLHGRA